MTKNACHLFEYTMYCEWFIFYAIVQNINNIATLYFLVFSCHGRFMFNCICNVYFYFFLLRILSSVLDWFNIQSSFISKPLTLFSLWMSMELTILIMKENYVYSWAYKQGKYKWSITLSQMVYITIKDEVFIVFYCGCI